MFGLFNVRKPPGPTSHDIVAAIRRRLPHRTKLGHAGTLDPFADGVLVLCAGPATRLADFVQAAHKQYAAEITLGATSTTDDPEGDITPTTSAQPPREQDVRNVIERFVGDIEQVPPAHSAVHVDGRRAYKLARRGETPALEPRTVTIHTIDVIDYDWPRVRIDVTCGSGTYIRALARDMGAALGVGGYCSALTRTAVGPFHLKDAVDPETLDIERDLIDPVAAVADMPRLIVDADATAAVAQGKSVPDESLQSLSPGTLVAIVDSADSLLAIAEIRDAAAAPKKVFIPATG